MLPLCSRALTLNHDSDVMIRMTAARSSMQNGDDVLSQRPLATGPQFFSIKSRDPTEQDIVPVPSRMSPAPHPDALLKPKRNVSKAGRHMAGYLSCVLVHAAVQCSALYLGPFSNSEPSAGRSLQVQSL